jgi:quercetin dioxygenase-like cupin family protein
METTFFGKRKQLFRHASKASLEFVSFDTEGRGHSHRAKYETCYVLAGSGRIVAGEMIHEVVAGSLITIPPRTRHWMIPGDDRPLDIVILYHSDPLAVVVV